MHTRSNSVLEFPRAAVTDTPAALLLALRHIAHFPTSVARIGMTGNEALAHVQAIARRAIANVEQGQD